MKLRELLQQLDKIRKQINVAKVFICGGAPRDKFMGHLENLSDLDLTNGEKTIDYLSQEFAIKIRQKYNIQRKTSEDGHSTIFIGNLKMDFSSNFLVPNIKIILAKRGLNNPSPLTQEVFSRDFTCNALLMDLDFKKIFDPTKRGMPDIKDKTIRTCLSPEITLTSNRNRVIRAVYLACKLGFDIDPSIISYVKQHPETVKISTQKAMSDKLNEAFRRDGDKASYLLDKMGIWNYVPVTEVMFPFYQKRQNV
jgi:tRNA nucleotidyltransferase/poly(A) polymerase